MPLSRLRDLATTFFKRDKIFSDSSAVEHLTVNQGVAGSNPAQRVARYIWCVAVIIVPDRVCDN